MYAPQYIFKMSFIQDKMIKYIQKHFYRLHSYIGVSLQFEVRASNSHLKLDENEDNYLSVEGVKHSPEM